MYGKIASKSFRPLLRNIQLRRFTEAARATDLEAPEPPLIKVYDVPAPHNGRIRILSLNHRKARNAISRRFLQHLSQEIEIIYQQTKPDRIQQSPAPKTVGDPDAEDTRPIRALIIASEVNNCFCAGADLKERADFSTDETIAFLDHLRNTYHTLANLPIPTLSAISSFALGGGLELALCTHFRVLASTAQVGLTETRYGIIPGAGGTYRLPALIGLSRARDLILTGRRVSAAEAYFLGIADRVVEVRAQPTKDGADPTAELLRTATKEVLKETLLLATQICSGGPLAIQCSLQAVRSATEEVENQMSLKLMMTEDRDEALKAFREKRKPIFHGR